MRISILFLLSLLISQESNISNTKHQLINKIFIEPGKQDALINNFNSNEFLYLVQLDLINDSLLNIVKNRFPDGQFLTGPGSFQRIMTSDHINQLSDVLTNEFYNTITYNRFNNNQRLFWFEVQQGNNTYGTWTNDEAISYDCSCLSNANDCVRLGWESWYNPFDYWGEAWYAFSPPYHQSVEEIRITIRGAQCDDLPLTSESYMGLRNDSGSWSQSYALSIDYTDNIFSVPTNIWSEGMIMPQIGSEDNYVIDFVRIEFFYTCNPPLSGPNNIMASDAENCSMVTINWETSSDESSGQRLYRDEILIATLDPNINTYEDWLAESGVEHIYCVENFNECGTSSQSCNPGSRLSPPDLVQNVYASDGTFENQILVNWDYSTNTNSYKIFRDGVWLGINNSDDLSYSDTFIELNISYEYCIEASNLCGESIWSCDSGFSSELPGDVNDDDLLNVLDVVLIVNVILNQQEITEYILWSADLNYDNNINIMDIILLINRILNI